MSIYDKASLVLIPSGSKTSKVYSQKPVSGDGDFTFSRSTAATRVNADGNIEKETQNLLLYSNTFSNANWTKSNAVVVGGQAGYDGSNDAWKVTSSAAGTPQLSQSGSSSLMKTHSIYAKAGNVSTLKIWVGATKEFDLSAGTTSSSNSKITDVGNGWYRCEVFSIFLNMNPFYSASAAGEFIYIQDAQQNYGLVAQDYIETTTTAVEGGITDNVPRLDYTDSSCPALLLEPQRTNKFPHSEFTGGYFSHNVTWTYNAAESPEGVDNALLSTYSGAGYFGDALPVTAGLTYTFSLYLKGDAGKSLRVYLDGNGSGGYFFTQEQILLDGTWTRYDKTYTIPAGASSVNLVVQNSSWGGHPSVTELYSYGLQFEEGSYATSYIPTYGSAVTRERDNCDLNDVTNIRGDRKGTIYVEGKLNSFDVQGVMPLTFGSATSNLIYIWLYTNGRIYADIFTGGTQVSALNTASGFISEGDSFKIAVAYQDNDAVLYVNGSLIESDNDLLAPNPNLLRIGKYNAVGYTGGSYTNVMVFPTRLSNEELATLTTI